MTQCAVWFTAKGQTSAGANPGRKVAAWPTILGLLRLSAHLDQRDRSRRRSRSDEAGSLVGTGGCSRRHFSIAAGGIAVDADQVDVVQNLTLQNHCRSWLSMRGRGQKQANRLETTLLD